MAQARSKPAKKKASSAPAVSGPSLPCTALRSMLVPYLFRMVPGGRLLGVRRSHHLAVARTAFSPSMAITTAGPEVMKRTRSGKKGRSLWTA